MYNSNYIDSFKNAIKSANNNLLNNKELINELNVFPVPDGDTGTNMSLTFGAATKEILKYNGDDFCELLNILENASLRGARGNSGVILSQLCRGITRYLKEIVGDREIAILDMSHAFQRAVDTASSAVMKPTPGTMLTVAEDIAKKAITITNNESIEHFVCKLLDEAKISLDNTPNLLPVLKQAGVVDAGGMGIIKIIEGIYFYLKGNPVELSEQAELKIDTPLTREFSYKAPTDIEFHYCTEFIINKKHKFVNVDTFKAIIERIGDSSLVIDSGDIVKVHIHTNNPGRVIERALKIGSLCDIKIDNMQFQHNSLIENIENLVPEKEFAIISISTGDGLKSIFEELGVDLVLSGGQSMNTSTEDIVNAAKSLNAKHIFVLPNNKNIVLSANQATEIQNNIIVIPTKSIPEGVSATIAFSETASLEENISCMNHVISTVKTGQVTCAVKNSNIDGVKIEKGNIIGLTNGNISAVGTEPNEVARLVIQKLCEELPERSSITIFHGTEVSEEQAQNLLEELQLIYDCDIVVQNGSQPLYHYIIAVE